MATTVGQYRIGELAAKVGLTDRTVYTDDDVRRLKYIGKLKMLGLTLQEMLELERMYRHHRSNRSVLPRLI